MNGEQMQWQQCSPHNSWQLYCEGVGSRKCIMGVLNNHLLEILPLIHIVITQIFSEHTVVL